MKRFISAVLTAMLIILSIGTVPVLASSSLIVDLDVSGYNQTDKTGILNAVTEKADYITIPTGNAPTLKSMSAISGTTYYLDFPWGKYIELNDPQLFGKNELTIELWAKPNAAKVYRLPFVMTNGTLHSMQFLTNESGAGLYVKPNGDQNGKPTYTITGSMGTEWRHYIVTRRYVAGEGKWYTAGYCDGVRTFENSFDGAAISESGGYYLSLGGNRANSTFEGCIGGMRVYSKALSASEAKAAFDETKYDFMEASQTMGLQSITPAEGDLLCTTGNIEINFDNYIDQSTLEHITFTKENGDAVPGKIIIKASDGYTKKVTIRHGLLEVGARYKVTIGSDVKSTNDIAYTGNREIVYTAVPAIIYENDFSGSEYVVNNPPPLNDGITYYSSGTADSAEDFLVLETEDGDKYVAGVSNAVSKSSQMIYNFEPSLSSGYVAIELGVKGYVPDSTATGTAAREVLRFYDGDDTTYKQFGVLSDVVTVDSVKSSPKADGFNYIKVVLSKGSDGNYNFDFYSDQSSDQYTRFSPSTSASVLTADDIGKVLLAHVYPTDESQTGTVGFAITSLKIYYTDGPGVIGGTEGEIAKTTDTVEVYFDSEMDESSLENAVYELKSSSGEETVRAVYSDYNADTFTLTLSLEDYLLPNTAYNLSIKNVLSASGKDFVGENILSVYLEDSANKPESAAISPLVVGGDVTATVNLPAGAETVCILTVYDSVGRIKNAKMETVSSAANTISLSVDGGVKNGDIAKLLMWEQTSGGYNPVTVDAVTLECN
ncbi:MAG: Ig-like domain-containing protein [Clostridia bacterium]|nr:Ig-like domain-containing protein [Clostridia bacterium]